MPLVPFVAKTTFETRPEILCLASFADGRAAIVQRRQLIHPTKIQPHCRFRGLDRRESETTETLRNESAARNRCWRPQD